MAKNPKILDTPNMLSDDPASAAIIAPTIMTDEIAFVQTLKAYVETV